MMRPLLPLLTGWALLLSACIAPATPPSAPGKPAPIPAGEIPAGIDPFAPRGMPTRTDEQGAIVVEVTPLELERTADSIEFEVSLNTHSVDLSMDLAPLSTLTTDTGLMVSASLWDAARGGHHVRGRLIFPATKDGIAVLRDASGMTLAIEGVDAPVRVFEWDLK